MERIPSSSLGSKDTTTPVLDLSMPVPEVREYFLIEETEPAPEIQDGVDGGQTLH